MLGDNIRRLRLERGLELAELAETIGISVMAVQYYEENKWRPGTEVISRLASALHVDLTELVDDCHVVRNENGEMLLVCSNAGKKFKVLGRIHEEGRHLNQELVHTV